MKKESNTYQKNKLSTLDFKRLSEFITQNYGIKLPAHKKVLLESRLQRRLNKLEIDSMKEYVNHVFSNEGLQNELAHMTDRILTNKTDFFRENAHFEFLKNNILPNFKKNNSHNSTFNIWSAGCSSGEEPYTMSFVLNNFAIHNQDFNYEIFATDVSNEMLNKSKLGIFHQKRIINIETSLMKRYFLKSKDKTKNHLRIVPELRSKIKFEKLNFMDSQYEVPDNFDIIFCKNVLIYFSRETQLKVIKKLATKLKHNAYLFVGLSESLSNYNLPFKLIRPSVYQKIS